MPSAAPTASRAERLAEQRLTALAQNLPIGIAFSEIGLRLGYVNDALVRLFDRTVDDLLGAGRLDFLSKHDQDHLLAALDAAAVGAKSTRCCACRRSRR